MLKKVLEFLRQVEIEKSAKCPIFKNIVLTKLLPFILLQVSATDADEGFNGKVLYFLSQDAHGAFTVDEETGQITTSALLDREKMASYSFRVFAVDLSPAAPRNSSAEVKDGLPVKETLLTHCRRKSVSYDFC